MSADRDPVDAAEIIDTQTSRGVAASVLPALREACGGPDAWVVIAPNGWLWERPNGGVGFSTEPEGTIRISLVEAPDA